MKKTSAKEIVLLASLVASTLLWMRTVAAYDLVYWPVAFLLLSIPFLIWGMYRNARRSSPISLSFPPKGTSRGLQRYDWSLAMVDGLLVFLVSACILLAAGPVKPNDYEQNDQEGIDIMLALDVSGSMDQGDFFPTRLLAAKRVAQEFVDARPDDRFGLVIYEAESFTQIPLTTDHKILGTALSNVRSGLLQGGTAVGMGLATAVNGLRNSEGESKVVILLTDGENNAGQIEPLDAARLAQSFGIYVHTIGLGPDVGPSRSNIDASTLQKIADMTDGSFSQAESTGGLERVFKKIDTLEKTRFDTNRINRQLHKYEGLASLAMFLFLVLLAWKYLLIRTTP